MKQRQYLLVFAFINALTITDAFTVRTRTTQTTTTTILSLSPTIRITTTQLFQSERVSENDTNCISSSDTADAGPEDSITTTNFATSGVGQATARLGPVRPTVWMEFSRLAQEHPDVANLGQGFPDWQPPQFALDALMEATLSPSTHQYTRPAGHPHLVQQLARRYSMHLHREIHPMNEVAVTVGASQALYLSLQTLIQPGDEVILFEPFFDLYVNQVKLAGGTPVFVPLEFQPYRNDIVTGGDWILNAEALKSKVNSNTKAIILNSPHNPTGKIFTLKEMEYIAESLELASSDCVVLSDEVYKYIVHAPPTQRVRGESLSCRGHIHFASLPGMWDRTITISSAGKTYSATGWQIGWCVGPRHLIQRIHQLLPYVQFCASTVTQEALARSLTAADQPYEGYATYYDYLRETYILKRNILSSALIEAGFAVPDYAQTPGGGFFILARIGPDLLNCIPKTRQLSNMINPAVPGGVARLDWTLCQWLAEEKGVLCIPSSPFFSEASCLKGDADEFVRVAFCKSDVTLQKGADALRAILKRSDNTGEESAISIQQHS